MTRCSLDYIVSADLLLCRGQTKKSWKDGIEVRGEGGQGRSELRADPCAWSNNGVEASVSTVKHRGISRQGLLGEGYDGWSQSDLPSPGGVSPKWSQA